MPNPGRDREINNQQAQQEFKLKRNLIIDAIIKMIQSQTQPVNEFNIITSLKTFSPDAVYYALEDLVNRGQLKKTSARDGRPQYRIVPEKHT